jgi:RNA polymerase sigma factor (sigma-70 family)
VNEQSDSQLLQAYAERHSETAFTELVGRHVDFVYSAALRMVCDAHLAEDVTQAVFVALAKSARQLEDRPMLSGWLHRTARNIAAQTVRTIERRRAREQQAVVMNELLAGEAEPPWAHIAPHLDAALDQLSEPDRDALLLRYFERKSARDIALALGVSDEAAQKRVTRALERLRELFVKRGVTIGAGGLAAAISAHAVHAAPAGLHLVISSAATLAGTTLASAATVTATKTIAMTSLHKTIAAAAIAIVAGGGVYEAHRASRLGDQVQSLQQQQATLTGQVEDLTQERNDTALQLIALRADNERLKGDAAELARLRSEIAGLRRNQSAPGTAPIAPAAPVDVNAAAALEHENMGRELGMAVVRGEPGALDKVLEMSKAAFASLKTNSVGLNDSQRGELSRRTFAPLHAAFKVIEEGALQDNKFAIDAVMKSLLIPELRSNAARCIGTLAGKGNDDAVEVLLNPNYGILLSTTVTALGPAADRGNQRAIDALAEVAKNPKNQPLWLSVANGLTKAASSGNPTAVGALIEISRGTNSYLRRAAVVGLEGAANNQNAAALEALRSMGVR